MRKVRMTDKADGMLASSRSMPSRGLRVCVVTDLCNGATIATTSPPAKLGPEVEHTVVGSLR